jgi:CHAT domain-containing protein/tetratricopeptide (TPR) repeat protein
MSRFALVVCAIGIGGLVLLGRPSAQAQAPSDSVRVRRAADAWAARAGSFRTRREVQPALAAYRKALRRYRQIGAQERVAAMTGDIGVMHWIRSRYEEALHSFEGALARAREVGDREEEASNLINIGLVRKGQGRYEQARQRYRAALQIHRSRGDEAGAGVALNNLGEIYNTLGQPRRALPLLRESLQIHRSEQDSLRMAINCTNLGHAQRRLKKFSDALESYRQALSINRAIGNRYGEADALNNMGRTQTARGRPKAGLMYHRQSLSLNRTLDRTLEVARNLANIGVVHEAQSRNEKARSYYRKALAINREHARRPLLAQNLSDLGYLHLEEGHLASADSLLWSAAQRTGALLQSASAISRRSYLSQKITQFHALATTRVRQGRPEAAFQVLEWSRAHLTDRERLGTRSSPAIPPVDSLQEVLAPNEAAVLYANVSTDLPAMALVVRRDSVYAHETDSARLRRLHRAFAPSLLQLQRNTALGGLRGGEFHRVQKAGGNSRLNGRDDRLANLVHLYRHDLAVPSGRQVLSDERRRRLGAHLRNFLVAPLLRGLEGIDELVVVPDGALGFLPFEALRDWDGTPLIEQMRVRYAGSLQTLKRLRGRAHERDDSASGLLAVGGAAYGNGASSPSALVQTRRPLASPDSSSPDSPDSTWAVTPRSDGRARASLEEGAVPRKADYERVGYRAGQWASLPGTQHEVERIEQIARAATVFTGDQASEQTLRTWARQGRLRNYRVLHFATHGLASPTRPSLSALVLSDVTEAPQPVGPEGKGGAFRGQVDGYLNAREIAGLDLNAEFVALSSCRSGLGRVYRGSGVLSLTQSFQDAGATATAVSLWAVYDLATSRFMEAFYRRALSADISWAGALAETKRAFASGAHGERLQDPRFWAPFVHYGWESP